MEAGISFMILIFIIINVALFWQNKISVNLSFYYAWILYIMIEQTFRKVSVYHHRKSIKYKRVTFYGFPSVFFTYFASNGHPFLAWNTAFRSR